MSAMAAPASPSRARIARGARRGRRSGTQPPELAPTDHPDDNGLDQRPGADQIGRQARPPGRRRPARSASARSRRSARAVGELGRRRRRPAARTRREVRTASRPSRAPPAPRRRCDALRSPTRRSPAGSARRCSTGSRRRPSTTAAGTSEQLEVPRRVELEHLEPDPVLRRQGRVLEQLRGQILRRGRDVGAVQRPDGVPGADRHQVDLERRAGHPPLDLRTGTGVLEEVLVVQERAAVAVPLRGVVELAGGRRRRPAEVVETGHATGTSAL